MKTKEFKSWLSLNGYTVRSLAKRLNKHVNTIYGYQRDRFPEEFLLALSALEVKTYVIWMPEKNDINSFSELMRAETQDNMQYSSEIKASEKLAIEVAQIVLNESCYNSVMCVDKETGENVVV